ncbi:hypothetical protein ESB13_09750 [Filimonas effusa]|uniref:Uncharacterized protein n=1 Tax=Filimonas effusa TaxID=2508721 RepID=A0A4V1MAU0_9BACT|nr:hypothetical protein ESB13_09750 [Filimonas effusa]
MRYSKMTNLWETVLVISLCSLPSNVHYNIQCFLQF